MEINTVLFSDVHLGTSTSRAYDLLNELNRLVFKQLIIVGDMFEESNFEVLRSTHWELLEYLGKLSRRNVNIIWIEGNHDWKFFKFMSSLIGIPVYNEYVWKISGRTFIALHGHQFDSFLVNNRFIGTLLGKIYFYIQNILPYHFFDFIITKIANKWTRLSDQVAKKSISYAKKRGADVVICGHTHLAESLKIDNIEYFNTGTWRNKPSHLLIVNEDGSSYLKTVA